MAKIYNYVIFHKNCIDGFSSFITLTKTNKISEDAIIFPDMPSAKSVPPNIKGKNLIIMDVAYNKNILESIIDSANTVTRVLEGIIDVTPQVTRF